MLALVEVLRAENARLAERVAELEARLGAELEEFVEAAVVGGVGEVLAAVAAAPLWTQAGRTGRAMTARR